MLTLWDQVIIEPSNGKKVEHNGVKIELLGQIGVFPSVVFFFFGINVGFLSVNAIAIVTDGLMAVPLIASNL